MIGEKFYHIDEPNQVYEVIREKPAGYFYAVLFHHTFMDVKHFKEADIDKVFFLNRSDCLDARINRAKRTLDLEIECKNRKI